ncbi:SurA N-terminal domain-containing protein [Acinetobacter tianfuensis]|uniref:Periplasmic chaperone PpiD n=1 Tax=Acinetobacter tianfuensis TaxID=2419603 RepID=A0A3A8EIT9_9GAMM|nr:SurA N-terminal domain-containing protein [Acinetobacter tianfuensis]RKG34048.1 peptidylprolyl isomerase [Acinetobacter tianfuensis]
MESFRKVIKGWLGKVLLVLFLTPLALVGIEGYFSGGSKDAVKSVNGTDISKKELEAATKSFKDQYLAYVDGDETLLNLDFINNKAMDTLISRQLLIQQAEKLGISLSDQQMIQMIHQQASFQKDGVFSDEMFAQYLASIGMTNRQFLDSLRTDHALKMLSTAFTDYPLVSKVDVQQIANLQTEQRSIQLASIPLDEYKKSVKVTDAEIAAYFEQHKTLFKQPTSADVDFVLLTPANIPAVSESVTDEELKQAYDAFTAKLQSEAQPQVKHILITAEGRSDADAQKRAADVAAKIKAGLAFDQAAAEYSEDPASSKQGGKLAVYSQGAFGDAFDKAVASTGAGQVSAPVKTDYGYHLIAVEGAAANVPAFETQKARLTEEVLAAKKANAFSDTVNSLNDLVISSDALDVISQEVKGAAVQTVKGLTLSAKHPVLSENAVKAKIFNEDVKNGDRNVSSSIQLANGNTVWIKVRNYYSSGEQSLAQVKPAVKAKLIEKKAYDAAKAKIAAVLAEFKTKPAAQVAKTGLVFENAGTFTRADGLLKRDIQRAAFSTAAPKAGFWSVTTASMPNELVVVAVTNVNKNAASGIDDAQIAELQKLYQQLRGQQEFDDYTRYLKANAKIK